MPSQTNITSIPSSRVDFIDQRTGLMSREWYRFFLNLFNLTGAGNNPTSLDDLQVGPPTAAPENAFGTVTSVQVSGGSTGLTTSGGPITSAGTITLAGTLAVANGGTGATTAAGARTNLGAGTVTSVAATAGTGISVTGSPITTSGTLNITNTAPDQVVALTPGSGISVSGTYPNFTIANTAPSSGGTVTSVAATAGTGISVTGSPITTSGTLNIVNTAPDQTVVMTSGTGISVTGTYPNFTVTNTSPSSGGTVTSVTGTSPVVSSGGTTPAISLASGYGDTQNPYASKTANYFLAAPNGSPGAPTFRAVVAADIPTLNQNTTGTASNITGIAAIANGGTGQSTASAGFNALSPVTSTGDLIVGNGTNSSTRLPIGANSYVLTSNGTTATWAASTGGVTSFSAGTTGFTPSTGTTGAVTLAGTLNVANGGTGLTSLTANYIPYGNGTSAFSSSANFAYNGTYLRVGATTPLSGATNPITAFTGSTNGYVQTYILNGNAGTSASADLVAYADNSTDAHGWADMGFTSSTYADATYTVTGKNEAYLFGSAPSGAGATGNMVYATDSTGSANAHQFYVGGFTQAKAAWKAQVDTTGLKATQVNATNGFIVNSMTVSANYTIATGDSAMSVGPMTIASGVSVTVSSGSRWVVI
jgi:hypothetical protein